MQARVKALVESGQLEFINGGWTMVCSVSLPHSFIISQSSSIRFCYCL
jgi:hypothetical protein